jgi:two-component system response regulator YesN
MYKLLVVDEAVNGKEALIIAAEFQPDIVTLDIRMPGLSGIEVGHILKKMRPEIKIVFVTAYEEFEYAREAIKIGAQEFVVKPSSDENVISILGACIKAIEEEKQQKNHREAMEVKINRISGYLESEFVNSVVNGEIDEQQAEDYLKFMLDHFVEGFGIVVEIDFLEEDDISHMHRNMIKKRFAGKLATLLDKNINFMLNQVKNTIYIFVFDYSSESRVLCRRLIEDEIQMSIEDFEEQLNVHIYYGFGECYKKIAHLWKSFAQAKVAARNVMLDNEDRMNKDGYVISNLEFRENELYWAIINEEDEIIQKADHILDNIIFTTNDINGIRLQLYEFFIMLNRFLDKESQIRYAVPKSLFEELKYIESRGEAKKYIHQYLYEVVESIHKQSSEKEPLLEDVVIQYIDKHFGEGITLDDIAHEIGFSQYYFGKVFKKTFDTTFTEYLTNMRIEKAKSYLMDNTVSVKDVTYRVGYMDPNYFTRVFKKHEGITPTEYRRKYTNQH